MPSCSGCALCSASPVVRASAADGTLDDVGAHCDGAAGGGGVCADINPKLAWFNTVEPTGTG